MYQFFNISKNNIKKLMRGRTFLGDYLLPKLRREKLFSVSKSLLVKAQGLRKRWTMVIG